ncbi:hypothetical protein MMC28_010276 [Mycoblastus sanguinarius]|nr:hypothetical protein [Mycoblastus sanguinarius]
MPCLFYLHTVILEYADQPDKIETFLGKLMAVIYEANLDTHASAEQLLVRLLAGIGAPGPERPERVHEVSRLVCIAKRLGNESRQKACDAMLMALIMPDDPLIADDLFPWDPNAVRDEVLED